MNAAAQLTYLHYQDVNTVTPGLVDEVERYLGFSSDLGVMKGGVLAVKRPPLYFDRRHTDGRRGGRAATSARFSERPTRRLVRRRSRSKALR